MSLGSLKLFHIGRRGRSLTPCAWFLYVTILPRYFSLLSQTSLRRSTVSPLPVPIANSLPFQCVSPISRTKNLPSVSLRTIPALCLDRSLLPSSLTVFSLVFSSCSSNPIMTASESLKRFTLRSQPCLTVALPHLYGPSGLRIIIPSCPSSRHFFSYAISSSLLFIFCGISFLQKDGKTSLL